MPTYNPSILISDCYGSAGSITFYHRDGKCRWRRRSSLSFTGTPSQCAALSIHRRALAAWRTIPDTEKERWHDIAKNVPPHRPPFGYGCHISGHNLFVSAYHGFVTLDSEPTENMADLKLVIMASAPQSNGVTRAYSKAVGIGTPKDPVSRIMRCDCIGCTRRPPFGTFDSQIQQSHEE